MSFAPYWAHFRIRTKEDFRYFFTDSILGSIGTLGFIGLMLLFYSATGQTLFFDRFTWQMLGWYLFITQLLIQNQANIVRTVSDQVQTGEIASRIAKPYHYPLALLSMHLASVFVESIAIILLAVPVILMVSGSSALSVASVAFGLVAIVLAFVMDFMISLSIGLIAFWTEDAGPYNWIYSKAIFVLGGLAFPLEVFPEGLRAVAQTLPPAYLLYYPASLISDFSWPLLWHVLIGQVAYLIIFTALAWYVYQRSKRRVSINGG